MSDQPAPDTTTVYIVDDDAGMLESTQWLLESVGLNVRAYSDGRKFLDALGDNRGGCGHADVPIVVRAFKSGAFDFIEKPFNEQLLLDSVQQALEVHQHSSHLQLGDERTDALIATLTRRERDVFLPMAQGYTSREIANQLGVSVKTIDLYRARVMKRLGAERLPDITGIAITAGMIDPLKLRT